MPWLEGMLVELMSLLHQPHLKYNNSKLYEGLSKITEPYLITFNSSKMDTYLSDISSQLYVIYSMAYSISVGWLYILVARQPNMTCRTGAFTL